MNRLRRFLDNPAVAVQRWYRPLAQEIIDAFGGQQYRLILDCTKLGFGYRLLTVALAYKKRALPLAWSVHRGAKSHATSDEQIALLRQVAPLLPKHSAVWVPLYRLQPAARSPAFRGRCGTGQGCCFGLDYNGFGAGTGLWALTWA